MKLKHMMLCAGLAAGMSFCAATPSAAISPYPLVPLSLSGTMYYCTNDGEKIMGAPINKVSFTTQSLISLLNASPFASNIIYLVTGKTKIPAGSSFLFDVWEENLIVTNQNGFSFPLYGNYMYSGTSHSYDFGYLEIDDDMLIGTYSLNAKTLAGSIYHSGGLLLAQYTTPTTMPTSWKALSLTRFTIRITAHPYLSAVVNGGPRLAIATLDLSSAKSTRFVRHHHAYVRIANVGVDLNATAVGAINTTFGTHLAAPVDLGTATVLARVGR